MNLNNIGNSNTYEDMYNTHIQENYLLSKITSSRTISNDSYSSITDFKITNKNLLNIQEKTTDYEKINSDLLSQLQITHDVLNATIFLLFVFSSVIAILLHIVSQYPQNYKKFVNKCNKILAEHHEKNIEQEEKIDFLIRNNQDLIRNNQDLLRDNKEQTKVMESCAMLATVMFQKHQRDKYSLISENFAIRTT